MTDGQIDINQYITLSVRDICFNGIQSMESMHYVGLCIAFHHCTDKTKATVIMFCRFVVIREHVETRPI